MRWVLVVLVLVAAVAANKCKYRYAERPPEQQRRPRICRGAGSFIGEDYWTTVSFNGRLKDGRSSADYLRFSHAPNTDGFVAYWITRNRYGDTHYEAFGHAYIRSDGRTCAKFVGLNKELVDLCGGFRVLSRNRFRPQEEAFEWVRAADQGAALTSADTLGFHQHRIAKHQTPDGTVLYGDAQVSQRDFQGISPVDNRLVQTADRAFYDSVWLLRRRGDVSRSGSQQSIH